MPAPTTVATPPLPYKAVAPATRHSREGGNPGWTRGGVVPTRTPRPPPPTRPAGRLLVPATPFPFTPRLAYPHAMTTHPPTAAPQPSPHKAVAQRPPATRRSQGQHQRPQVRSLPRRTPSSAAPHQAHGRRGDAHGPAGAHAACPHQEQPPPRLSAEDTPWANRPGKGPRPKSIEGGPSNSFGKGAPAGKQLLFYPPRPASKVDKKTQSNLTQGD